MTSWFFLAILGHLSNAISFVIDKTLLRSTFKKSATYAAMIGGISFVVVLLSPWVHTWPAVKIYPYILGFGGFFVLALWAFFEALRKGEASRVVPIIGSLIPIFTLIGSLAIFRQNFTGRELIGFGLLLLATWLLTSGGKKEGRIPAVVVAFATAASLLFAAASLCGKYAFDHADWVGVFILSRVVASVIGIGIGFMFSGSRLEILKILRGKNSVSSKEAPVSLAIFGQICGGIGFALVNFALAEGSAALVNALQAVQYAAIILAAWFGGSRLRRALNEEVTKKIVLLKFFAILCVAAGLSLIA
ncbi:MAG TPA: EamA family transporter [Patescibacteria group bacterium]|nr:EamA family transporter [Patescibacteria group bacterium]